MTINANNNNNKKLFPKKKFFWKKNPTTTPASMWQATEKVIECILQEKIEKME